MQTSISNKISHTVTFLDSERFIERMANNKALMASKHIKEKELIEKPILAADTVVVHNGTILDKPSNKDDAISMLRLLSGTTHSVLTAIALKVNGLLYNNYSTTSIEFSTIEASIAEQYCLTGEPYDKAGSYAIQGLGAAFVKNIIGSYSGAVGLPLWKTIQLFNQLKIPIWNVN